MTSQLPPNLLRLFQPRPELEYKKPLDRSPASRRGPVITGVGEFLERCKGHDTNYVPTESIAEQKKRKKEAKVQKAKEKIEAGLAVWDPNKDEHAQSDPYKTLFVARLTYNTTEKELKRAFEKFGHIKSLRIVRNQDGKSRGYAFIEFEREKDMKMAYKEGAIIKVDDTRPLVDVERGRTVKGWRPRRLGGGLGGTRIGGDDVNQKYNGREGGYRGGSYDGGFRGGPPGGFRGGPPGGFRGGPPGGFRGGYGGGYDRGYGGGMDRRGGYGDRPGRHDYRGGERPERFDRGGDRPERLDRDGDRPPKMERGDERYDRGGDRPAKMDRGDGRYDRGGDLRGKLDPEADDHRDSRSNGHGHSRDSRDRYDERRSRSDRDRDRDREKRRSSRSPRRDRERSHDRDHRRR